MKKCIIIAAWSVALALSASAQNASSPTTTLVLEATIPGTAAFDLVVLNQLAGRDFNDDGVPDIAFINRSAQLIVIVDGTNPENRWTIDGGSDDLPTEEIVFFIDLDPAAGLKAIIIAERQGRRYVHPIIIDAEGDLLWDGSGRVLLTIDGMGADVTEEIVVFNPQIPRVEIWGVVND